jgi:predicted phage terminase large subunit-like protein
MAEATATSADARRILRPQPGPQEMFLSSPADIVIYGGSAGGGKTFGLLLEPTRHLHVAGFSAVIFRREATQIVNEGGLWDESLSLYPSLGGRPVTSPRPMFRFPSKTRVAFAHLNRPEDVHAWHGAQVPLIGFDEVTQFERSQFFYMLSRNRSTCGVRPYIRATCNPDPDSWVADFIAWWIDPKTGYPIPERSGRLRWFIRGDDDALIWGDSAEELVAKHGVELIDCKSVTFIASTIFDNPALLQKDPGYLANLRALPKVERERLLGGNWKIRPAAGMYFLRHDAVMLEQRPEDCVRWVRAWDLAATEPTEEEPDPDWTAGVLMGLRPSGRPVVAEVVRVRRKADEVRRLILRTAQLDGRHVSIRLPQDPGQAGKGQAADLIAMLSGYPVFAQVVTGDKVTRALPLAAQWQAGNVEVVRGPWNEAFFGELEGFPKANHDDQVDAAADAFVALPRVASTPDYSRTNVRGGARG